MTDILTKDERWLARTLFANRLLKANDKAFQSFFWSVMRAIHGSAFVEVRPQGTKGDGGNDGYLPADGHYYQEYGPLEPTKKAGYAAKKLADDFTKVKKGWARTNPVRAYTFVFNDKYEGVFREIAEALDALKTKNKNVTFHLLTAALLEDLFMTLPRDGMVGVLNAPIPDPKTIISLQFGVLKEVIEFILSTPAGVVETRFGDLPGLDEKIKLNGLSSQWADMIRAGARQTGHVDAYFAKNSTFTRQHLRDHMVEQYRQSCEWGRGQSKLPMQMRKVDVVFADFRERLTPAGAIHATTIAVDTLIGYYFEVCDVFDPHANPGSPNASP